MAVILAAVGITAGLLVCGWFLYQLLRQNGRLLRRIEAIEARLDLPAGDRDRPRRFGYRSLTNSRINRNGLRAGTPAPSFRLPRVEGGELALEEYRGRRVLLVFSSPDCGPCQALAPKLEELSRKIPDVHVVMVSRGSTEANRGTIDTHKVSFPVVLQRHWEVSREYGRFVTPMAYLIDEQGVLASNVTEGVAPILALLSRAGTAASLAPSSDLGVRAVRQ